ncbi:MAG TPA: type IV toxin-antitoxin system AbiEi family antitoxin domain-containing protein [Gemmatimonadaceae bacterium]|jgi:predicted transcriptional regulator of viral defense system|nr:type IV toxin-antitoxin system AbiEi family antitoxin domain-containing protein [Gemmatimonadaceae bacterium]
MRSTYRAVYALAEEQMGYVTTAQARVAGIQPMALVMMARRGVVDRASHGVYRLVDFPSYPLAQLMHATLWPNEHRGVLSHETALALHEMSDVDPPAVHITVPATYRVQRATPRHMIVHRADLVPEDVMQIERMPVTTPERTVRDCLGAHVGPAILRQAIEDGERWGRLTPVVAAMLREEVRRGALHVTAVAKEGA